MIASLLYGNDMPTTANLFDKAVDVMANTDHSEEDLKEVAEGLLNAYVALSKIHGDEIEFLDTEREKIDAYQEAYLKSYKFEANTDDIWLPESVPDGSVPKRAVLMLGEVNGGRDQMRLKAIQREMDRMDREGVA